MKEFLLLIRENVNYGNLSMEEMQKDIQKHVQWVETLIEKGHFKEGNPLDSNGITLKNEMVTDGPYIETKECVSGYYFLLAHSLQEATELAKGCPDFKCGSTLEIREILKTDE
ncbi:YciI family protein [Chryseobacterium lathyri]|uniref:YciI family protein n=1 Tax=Chryseobacterium lathyri TaxID=395933 RepID=UPI00277F23F9|nr:YciI family protein [Chryseobacterium lathyri]MDQ0064875.1 hypothetical protein [Chryseobacterium lathyri]